jgi:hypothetical protein
MGRNLKSSGKNTIQHTHTSTMGLTSEEVRILDVGEIVKDQ